MSTYGEQKKAWAKKWAYMRQEFLEGKLLDALVFPTPDGEKFRWECPLCGNSGSNLGSEKLAHTAGRGHMQSHVTPEDYDILEDLKVLNMPESLLTPFQRRRRDELQGND